MARGGQEVATFALGGGLDTSSPALGVPPGALMHGMNYEPLAEGYGRVDGYERFDGQTAPSATVFDRLGFDNGSIAIEPGDTVTGATSGATGIAVAVSALYSGTWDDGTAAGDLALANVAGAFVDNEVLVVSGTPHALADGVTAEDDAPDDDSFTAWSQAAQEWRRTTIGQVPGSGPVRGVAVHAGDVFAWRDNADTSALLGYRATTTGWQALTVSYRIAFTSGGADPINEGDTITGATSGATAVVRRVVVNDGAWSAGTAEGWLHVTSISGVFTSENVNVGASPNLATITAPVANTFGPGGRVRALSHNFYGAANQYRLYGATSAANAFELLGDTMVPMFTGMADDKPQRIFEIGNSLGLTFEGGSVQLSATGEPLNWQPILGAGEIGFGTDITDVVQANETAVAIFGVQKIGTLTGHDTSDFQLDILTEEAGADPDTAQRIARTVYVDRRGLRSLDATQAYGNFKTGALSQRFEAHFRNKRRAGARAVGSVVSRTKSQYRLFWDDGTGLSIYMGAKEAQAIPFNFGFAPFCFGQGELDDGEGIFVGGEDGFVYRLDSGCSFDGQPIDAVCMPAFNHLSSAMLDKRFHKVTLELRGPPKARIGITAQFDYADPDQPIDDGRNFDVRGGGGLWDQANWDDFAWSDPIEGVAECYIDGIGRNIGLIFATTAALTEPAHILQAYSIHFTPRKVKR